jgi:Uma2 family endonuclease
MATTVAAPQKLITAEEYIQLPDHGEPRELRRGVVVAMNLPGFRHGVVCGNVYYWVSSYVRQHQSGWVLSNDSGIITERNPDTVRGGDVTYYSFQRVPKGESPVGYAGALPEIVFEVVSPTNTRKEIALKTGEYLHAGVNVVCVVDPQFKTVNLHFPDRPDEKLQGEDSLTFAELPGFSLPVARFFE